MHFAEESLQRWMTALDDALPLSALTLAGSHDTCAYTVDDALARTQNATLADQLDHGVRVLDIRCRHQDDVFHINHAGIALGLMFDDVIATCAAFLAQHPGECIVMSVKDECGTRNCTRGFDETFSAYVRESHDVRWYLNEAIPRLGEVRGSIVLLRRFSSDTTLGIDLSAWPDNTSFDLDDSGAAFAIQDEFRVPVRASIEYKWHAVNALLERTSSLNGARWAVNFCSGTGMAANPAWVAWGDAQTQGINARLIEWLAGHDRGCGTMMLDFCERHDWSVVRALVTRNRV
ncbi:phosphatidylinositol-specific phospholipase C [Paraburkholderia sp.]|uniref:phosphatidylinositol-specific phospholipase C n=1 Tax=Paraburkholderia sp. TaxID=1926495 RepID=UPI0023A4BE1D|nr:phosphatidylinositol-specific phospholipase C [Paraburkholderia sp.]MDE1179284.1 phosphatidylinositol-specific phospholipase C [Paraburkholderia sp.]